MPAPAASSSRARLQHAALLALALTPIAFMACTVLRTWLPLPYWDEWSTPAENLVNLCKNNLTFQELFSQHNESRKLFPRLLYLGLAQLGGWDVRKEMAITFLFVVAIAFLFYRLLRQMPGATSRAALIVGSVATFLCFSPVQLENFLWGVQLEVFFPGLAVLALIAINLSALSLERKALLNGLLAFVATYTVAHGMLLWLLGIPLLTAGQITSTRRKFLVYGAYALCAAAAVTAYFVGYQRPPHHPQFLAGHPGVLAVAHYLILWVGSYFYSAIADPFAVGLAAIILLSATLLASLWLIRKHHDWRPYYPGFIIAGYACATAGITVLGRIGFGVQQALDTRYRPYSVFFYLAIIALLFALYHSHFRRAGRPLCRLFFAGCCLLAFLAFTGWIACYLVSLRQQEIIRDRNLVLLRALEWIEVVPDNPDLRYLFPKPETLLDRVRLLRQHRVLRLPFVSDEIARGVQAMPQPRNGDPFGQLEICVIDANKNLWITGRAELPDRKQPPDCILIGAADVNGHYKPISLMETKRPRGGGKTRAGKQERLLFGRTISPANLPPGDITIAAWAVDLQSGKLYPLAGVTFIRAAQR